MNNTFLTAANAFTVGSTEIFESTFLKDGILWDMTGATVRLKFADPNGAISIFAAFNTYLGGAQVSWTVPNIPGRWIRAWDITDSAGIRQVSKPMPFDVISSPI